MNQSKNFQLKLFKLISIFIFAFISLILLPFFGTYLINILDLPQNNDLVHLLLTYRIPRILIAFVSGSLLALGGLLIQSIFSNVLATPYTLGISSASALGAVLAMYLNISFSLCGIESTTLFAMLFSLIFIVLLYFIARKQSFLNSNKILLIGIALNMLCSSILLFIQINMDYMNTFKILHWLVGSINNVSYEVFFILLIVLLCSLPIILSRHLELDLLSVGEDFALSKGVSVQKIRWLFVILSSTIVGVVVSFLGPIAFVGLIVPNISRALFGSKHLWLTFVCILLGGTLLIYADLISRVILPPVEIPLGIFTSLLGALFFLYLIFKNV